MKQNYAQLPEEEKEKDRVVAKALLQALKGQQGVAEGSAKRKMEADAEKMSLEQFCDKYGDEDWIKEFWKTTNAVEDDEQLNEISANPAYLRAAERSRSQAQATQRTPGKSPEEKAAARRTELKRDAGIAGYSKRHKAAHPEMYPKVKAQPAPRLRDPSTEYSDDYSTWAAGRRDTMEDPDQAKQEKRKRLDPELQKVGSYAQGHYTDYRDDPETALLKLLQRSSEHGEETDRQQDRKIRNLERKIDTVNQQMSSMPMAESRAQRRTLLKKILKG